MTEPWFHHYCGFHNHIKVKQAEIRFGKNDIFQGKAAITLWMWLWELACTSKIFGCLAVDEVTPYDAETIALELRYPEDFVQSVLDFLLEKGVLEISHGFLYFQSWGEINGKDWRKEFLAQRAEYQRGYRKGINSKTGEAIVRRGSYKKIASDCAAEQCSLPAQVDIQASESSNDFELSIKLSSEAKEKKAEKELPKICYELANLIADSILENHPKLSSLTNGKRATTIKKYAKDVDYMLRNDKRTESEIKAIMNYIKNDVRTGKFPGWGKTVQSASNLREKWDKIFAQMPSNPSNPPNSPFPPGSPPAATMGTIGDINKLDPATLSRRMGIGSGT